jgi:mRNA interferase HigB
MVFPFASALCAGYRLASILLVYIVNVICKRELFEKAFQYPDAITVVRVWYRIAVEARWKNLEDVRRAYPSTDMIGPLAIFNIGGNKYRLIVRLIFRSQRIYIKELLTHAEYDKERWKKWL